MAVWALRPSRAWVWSLSAHPSPDKVENLSGFKSRQGGSCLRAPPPPPLFVTVVSGTLRLPWSWAWPLLKEEPSGMGRRKKCPGQCQSKGCTCQWLCWPAVPAMVLCSQAPRAHFGRGWGGKQQVPGVSLAPPSLLSPGRAGGPLPLVEDIRDNKTPSPHLSAWLPLPPVGHQVPPPLLGPAFPASPQTHTHAEEEHLEALFQPFTIVRITTSNQEMLLRRRQSYSPLQEGKTERQKQTGMNSLQGRRGSAPAPPPTELLSQALHPCTNPPPLPPPPALASLPSVPPHYSTATAMSLAPAASAGCTPSSRSAVHPLAQRRRCCR